jgi:hypothetical protein
MRSNVPRLLITGDSTSVRFLFAIRLPMAGRRKLDLKKIRASADVICSHCGARIPPERQQRVDFEHMECPRCAETFVPSKK